MLSVLTGTVTVCRGLGHRSTADSGSVGVEVVLDFLHKDISLTFNQRGVTVIGF